MYYNARWYDSYLGRFVQADTIIPLASQGSQAFDRYGYVNNSPVNFSDSTGHTCEDSYDPGCADWNQTTPYDPGYGWDIVGKYDGNKAAEYAKINSKTPANGCGDGELDCTNFASQALYAGGLPNWGDWFFNGCGAPKSPWIDTTQFYQFLTKVAGFTKIELVIGKNGANYNTLSKDPGFQKLLKSLEGKNLVGSLIFFSTQSNKGDLWTHVAVITGWDKASKSWEIIDHSGPTNIVPRGIDSSTSKGIMIISIVLITDQK